jgi:hypothetical protein
MGALLTNTRELSHIYEMASAGKDSELNVLHNRREGNLGGETDINYPGVFADLNRRN